MDYVVLLEKMVIFIALMITGYFLARRGVIGPEFTRSASRLVIDVFMVGTILSSIITTGSEQGIDNLGEILLLTFTVIIAGYIIAEIAMKFFHIGQSQAPSFEILMAVGNSMFIALPIAQSIYGSYAVLIVSVSCIAFNALLYSYGIWRLKGGTGDKIQLRDMISIPLVATLIGILIVILKIPVPGVLMSLFSILSGATMPMSMIVIGASLGSVSLLEAFRNPSLALLRVMRLIVIPILSWMVCSLITNDSVLLMTCMIIAASPSAVMITILAIRYGQDSVFCSEGVLHTTVCSMVTIPLLIGLLSRFS